MKRNTAKEYDRLLQKLIYSQSQIVHNSQLVKMATACGFTENLNLAIGTFLIDGLLEAVEPFEEDTANHFQLYKITHKAVVFTLHEGGYSKKRRREKYEYTNLRFAWLRHWVWFYTAMASLIVNIYFIATYLLK